MAVLEPSEIFYTNFEGKLQDKFLMYIDGIPSFLMRATARPTITNAIVEYDHINIKRKQKGKTTYNSITVTLYDAITPSGAQAVMEWLRMHHEAVTGREGYSDMYKKDVTIHIIDPVGAVIEEWILKGCIIENSDFGQLDWQNAEKLEITISLAYDYPILNY